MFSIVLTLSQNKPLIPYYWPVRGYLRKARILSKCRRINKDRPLKYVVHNSFKFILFWLAWINKNLWTEIKAKVKTMVLLKTLYEKHFINLRLKLMTHRNKAIQMTSEFLILLCPTNTGRNLNLSHAQTLAMCVA